MYLYASYFVYDVFMRLSTQELWHLFSTYSLTELKQNRLDQLLDKSYFLYAFYTTY